MSDNINIDELLAGNEELMSRVEALKKLSKEEGGIHFEEFASALNGLDITD